MADAVRCQSCGEREATVVITKMIGHEHQVVQLCHACAGTFGGPGGVAVTLKVTGEGAGATDLHCPACGRTFVEFRKTGLFGCAACYEAFEPRLEKLFRRVQGVSRHVPEGQGDAETLSALDERLRQAVQREAFEEAAELRDRIGRLRGTPSPARP